MLKSIGSTWVVTFVTILVVFLVTPYVIAILGEEKYGVWLTITALTGFLDLIRGGLPAASVKHLAIAVETDDAEARGKEISRVVHSALWLYLVLAVACFFGGMATWAWWRWYGRPVPEALQSGATIAFVVVVVKVAFGFLAHLPGAVMEAHEDFVARNGILLGSILLTNSLTVGLLFHDAQIVYLALAVGAGVSLELIANTAFVLRRYRGVSLGVGHRDRTLIKTLVHYSAWVLVLAAGGRLAFNTDAIVISTFDSYDGVAFYNVANSIALYFMEFIGAIAIVVLPRAARLRASGDAAGLRGVFLQWSKVSMSLALLVGTFLLFMGPEFLGFWINDEFQREGGPSLQILIASFLFFLPMRGAAVPVLMAVGDVRVPALAFIAMGVLNVGASIVLVGEFGIIGAAIGTAVPNALFAAVVFQFACREAEASRLHYLKYVVLKPLIGLVPVVAWLWVCRFVFDATGFFGLLYSGVGTVVLFVLLSLGFVYRNDPYSDPWNHPRIRRLRGLE